jgi:hypothetical protein
VNDGSLQSSGTSEVSGLSGIVNSGTIEVQSGSLKLDTSVSGVGALKIDAGATLELSSAVAAGQTVTFTGTTGTLKLDQAENFNGVISGFSGTTQANSDHIDLADINFNTLTENIFNAATDTLTLSDGTNTAVIHFSGTVGTLNVVADGNTINGVSGTSGTLVYDPPSQAANATIAVTAPNQNLVGHAASDNFVFNFAAVGHTTVADFHPSSDTLQFDKSIFANAQAILNATRDDGHGNTVIAIDGHDSIALNSVVKSQLHTSDFHIV